MPTLQFKGKNIIWNHHLSVPYHTLEEVEELNFQPEKGNDNIIIEGDNLLALKALIPEYAGKVKCVYIDPPYNTGKEEWVYSDKVNSPLITEWFKSVVGKEDLTRHDKWLCMMVPRLKLLRELLSKEGVIFISLDNNEAFNFKLIMDEIFQEENFLGVIIVQTATDNNPTQISTEHEYMFCYSRDKEYQSNWEAKSKEADLIQEKYLELKEIHKDNISEIQTKLRSWVKDNKANLDKVTHYNYVDEIGVFYPGNPSNTRMGGYTFDIIHPVTKKVCSKPEYGYRWPDKTFWAADEKKDVLWGIDETTIPKIKKRLETVTASLKSIIYEDGRSASKEIEQLLGKDFFKNPKSPKILKKVFEYCTEENDIILDSFGGSGTTGQAVMQLNEDDGGNRKFILIQMKEDSEKEPNKNICLDKTRTRIQKVIEAYNINSGFKYLRVGTAIDPEQMLEGNLPTYEQFAKYIYYLGTGENLKDIKAINPKTHFVGNHGSQDFYLIYEPDLDSLSKLALNLSLAEDIVKNSPNKRRMIYAPACFLDADYMEEKQIEFVSIPFNLFEKKSN
ncbi:MAG: site-specific DNA-methyltransferase [Flavobacteriia bacterium]|nr:MAG: site-specific DNA-methyltransferase [Flavobacteriia bacterium]